jgi:hypothetical protein
MLSGVRVAFASALLSVGAVSAADAGGYGYGYGYGGYGYGGYGYGGYGYGYGGYYGTSCGCGGCGCGGGSSYAVQQAYVSSPPVYVVNQGPTYTGSGLTVPVLNYWSHGAVRAYPYIRGGHGYYDAGYSYPAYAPAYRRGYYPYHHRRALRVYGSMHTKGAKISVK